MLTELINKARIENLSISERIKVYEASFGFYVNNSPSYDFFIDIIDIIPKRDRISIILQDEAENIFSFSDKEHDENRYNEFITKAFDDEKVQVKLSIEKKVYDSHFSIYSYDDFAKDILSLPTDMVMKAFSELLKNVSGCLVFDTFDNTPIFRTRTMLFVSYQADVINQKFNRDKRLEECKEVSYFYNFDIYELLPDDFVIDIDFKNNPLTYLFENLCTVLSMGFIASSASIENNKIKGIINGQRTMEYCCQLNELNNKILYRIYNWMYTDGNSIDKAIIARNVISLHCKYIPISELDEKVMISIQSNYQLYLRDNVNQYLELKNKLAEFISEVVSKTGEYATELLNKFKSNLIAIFGFIFTVILANIVSDQPLDNIFTRDITILVEFVLLGSFVYLILCYFQSRYEIKKVFESYNHLKHNYKDVLCKEELDEAFDNDVMIKNMKLTIKKSERIYLSIWVAFLLLSIVVIELISTSPNHKIIFELIYSTIKG